MSTRYRIFVSVTPGLEHLLEQELHELGVRGGDRLEGGLELGGERRTLWRVCLCSRLAESARVRLGKAFTARTFDELRAGLLRLPWAAYLPRGSALPEVRVTCHRSRLYHSGAVAERVLYALAERLDAPGETSPELPRIHLRLERDRVQVSVDASGELLHRRGYRRHVGEAPMRETLAAACLRAAGYDGTRPLWDPFCGAGTLPLEALGLATGTRPGAGRSFAFEAWPTHDAAGFAELRAGLPSPCPAPASVLGSDVDADALEAASSNAAAAGLAPELRQGDFAAVADAVPAGTMIVTNPPYGHRLGGEGEVYRRLGDLLREREDLGPVFMLTGRRGLSRATGLPWEPVLAFSNRGLPVRLMRLAR